MNTRPPYGLMPEGRGEGRIPSVYGDIRGDRWGFGNQPPAHSVSQDDPPYAFAAWRGDLYEQEGEE